MISCQKSCRHSAKVGNFQKIKRKSVRFIFILHFTLHSNLLTFGIWQGKVSTFFFRPKKLLPKKNLQIWITYWLLARLCLYPHRSISLPTHTHTHAWANSLTPTHTLKITHTYLLAVITFSMTFYWPSVRRTGNAIALSLKLSLHTGKSYIYHVYITNRLTFWIPQIFQLISPYTKILLNT